MSEGRKVPKPCAECGRPAHPGFRFCNFHLGRVKSAMVASGYLRPDPGFRNSAAGRGKFSEK